MSTLDLSGKRAIVSGASSGLGLASAEALAEGYRFLSFGDAMLLAAA